MLSSTCVCCCLSCIMASDFPGTLKMMNMLLSHGADVNVLNKTLRTPLHLAVDYNQGNMNDNFDLVLALMNKGADLTIKDVRGRIPLHYVFVKRGR